MKNFDTKLLRQSAKSLIKRNSRAVYTMALYVFAISIFIEALARILGLGGSLSTIPLLISTILLAPLHIGQLNAYYRMSQGENVSRNDALSWYKDGKKLADSIKTEGYYIGTLLMWFIIYVLFPMAVVYMIWGKSLMAGDAVINMAVAAILFTGVLIVAVMPYFIHMLRYSGGLFYAGQQTHLNISMRFAIGKDFIAPHVYRYAVVTLCFVPYILLSFAPIVAAIMFSDMLGIFSYVLGILGYAFAVFVYLPYYNMTSMLMFERMQNPKKEIKYDIKGADKK